MWVNQPDPKRKTRLALMFNFFIAALNANMLEASAG
jgi:hypothetical protein